VFALLEVISIMLNCLLWVVARVFMLVNVAFPNKVFGHIPSGY